MFGQILAKMATSLAIIGGLVLLTVVLINVLSIIGRVLFSSPLVGDFELIEMGCALGVHAGPGSLSVGLQTTK